MQKNKLDIDTLITIDKTGMPQPPNLRQLLDKDVRELYIRDKTPDKSNYIKECGVIYYLGDPRSPANQKGLSKAESLKLAIENFDLSKVYKPDFLVARLIKRYYDEKVGIAGEAVLTLQKSIHNITLAASKLNELLNNAISSEETPIEEVSNIINLMSAVSKQVGEIPTLTKKLVEAMENILLEKETKIGRGDIEIVSSMSANDEID